MPDHAHSVEFSLYTETSERKYLNRAERQRLLVEMAVLPEDRALFCLTLAWTGARISEVLTITTRAVDLDEGAITLRTLKRRKVTFRRVPVPPELLNALDRHFHLRSRQHDPARANARLWPWHRVTAWRIVKRLMRRTGVSGRAACPKGFRHGFGIATLQSGVPVTTVQKWLGHSRLSTTSIYTAAIGLEDQAFAAQYWHANRPSWWRRIGAWLRALLRGIV